MELDFTLEKKDGMWEVCALHNEVLAENLDLIDSCMDAILADIALAVLDMGGEARVLDAISTNTGHIRRDWPDTSRHFITRLYEYKIRQLLFALYYGSVDICAQPWDGREDSFRIFNVMHPDGSCTRYGMLNRSDFGAFLVENCFIRFHDSIAEYYEENGRHYMRMKCTLECPSGIMWEAY